MFIVYVRRECTAIYSLLALTASSRLGKSRGREFLVMKLKVRYTKCQQARVLITSEAVVYFAKFAK